MPLHPDAAAVYSKTWAVDAPNIQSGRTILSLVSKRMNVSPDEDASRADEIAAALINNPVLVGTGTSINDEAIRRYEGEGLTALAKRRG